VPLILGTSRHLIKGPVTGRRVSAWITGSSPVMTAVGMGASVFNLQGSGNDWIPDQVGDDIRGGTQGRALTGSCSNTRKTASNSENRSRQWLGQPPGRRFRRPRHPTGPAFAGSRSCPHRRARARVKLSGWMRGMREAGNLDQTKSVSNSPSCRLSSRLRSEPIQFRRTKRVGQIS
jgi:hypothetical protein